MPGSWPPFLHPLLSPANCVETSLPRAGYNCIAWAAGDQQRWWWPDAAGFAYWPAGVAREISLPAFIAAFQTLGYELCNTGDLEPCIQKVAVFGRLNASGQLEPTHAARQLDSGHWTSKMGQLEDIVHTEAALVGGPFYGQLVCYMGRPRTEPDPDNVYPHPNASLAATLNI